MAPLDQATLERFDRTREVPVGERGPIPIWIVVVDGGAYVRSYKGESGRWYQRARERGRAVIGGVEVGVEPIDDAALDERISDAFRAKYGETAPRPTAAMVSPEVTATTLRLTPRRAVNGD
jgi:hypothetical protein